MENETEQTKFWNKKQEDLTVGDNLKIAGGVMVVATVAPIVVMGGVAIVVSAVEKIQEKRRLKKFNKELAEMESK